MERKWIKLAVLVSVCWLITLSAIVGSYRSVENSQLQVEELGYEVEKLRNSFYFDNSFRAKLLNSQELNLQILYALRLQIGADYRDSWLSPDLNQLLYTVDRFIDLAKAYVDNEVAVSELARQIRRIRTHYPDQHPLSDYYFQLSANVFETLYDTSNQSIQAARDVDRIYQHSTLLEGKEKKELQQVVAEVSLVLGSYAQGSYFVDNLIAHDVSAELAIIAGKYQELREQHLMLAILVSLLTVGALLSIILLTYHPAQSRAVAIHREQVPPVSRSQQAKADSADDEINFDDMVTSLNGDIESVCMLLRVFVSDHAQDIQELRALLTESPVDAQRKAHSLKGIGGSLGVVQLRDAAAELETAIAKESDTVPLLLVELEKHLDATIKAAQTFLNIHNVDLN